MYYAIILSLLLLTGSGAGLVSLKSDLLIKVPAAVTRNYVQSQDTVQEVTKTGKRKKKEKVNKTKSTRVITKRNVMRASLIKKGEAGNHIEVVVIESGLPLSNLEDLQLIGSSGSTQSLHNFQSFENVTLPFEGFIKFRSANKMNSAIYDREVRFFINDPGKWVLRIDL